MLEKSMLYVVPDNVAGNLVVKRLMKEERPHISWFSCSPHYLFDARRDWQGKMIKDAVEKARVLTHHKTCMMHHFHLRRL